MSYKFYVTGKCGFCRYNLVTKNRFDEKFTCNLYAGKDLTRVTKTGDPGIYVHPLDECEYNDLMTHAFDPDHKWWENPIYAELLKYHV